MTIEEDLKERSSPIILKIGRDNINHIPFQQINDRHKDKRCFILGTAPTIDQIDLNKLKGEITFGLNNIYDIYTPNYWVSINFDINNQNINQIFQSEILFINNYFCCDINNTMLDMNKVFTYFACRRSDIVYPILTKINSDIVAIRNGGSVLFPAIQFALAMGCNPIYLIGVSYYSDGLFHKYFAESSKITNTSSFDVRNGIKTMQEIKSIMSKESKSIFSLTPNCLFADENIIQYINYNDLMH